MLEHATGTPRRIASTTGSPKPSAREGKTTKAAAAYRPSSSAGSIQPRKRTSSSIPSRDLPGRAARPRAACE